MPPASSPRFQKIDPPGLLNFLLEGRFGVETLGGLYLSQFSEKADSEKKLPVLVIPGFATGDLSTWILRRYLRKRGYAVSGWEQGINLGSSESLRDALRIKLRSLYQKHNQKVALVGWSLGGVYARELARDNPDKVASIVSLASPFSGSPYGNRMFPIAQWLSGKAYTEKAHQGFLRRMEPPPVPTLALHSKTDGIVDWRCSLEKKAVNSQNQEVCSSHFGFVANPVVLQKIDEFLSRPD